MEETTTKIFHGWTSWFSSSVSSELQDKWKQHGGEITTSLETANYMFSSNARAEDTKMAFTNIRGRDVVMFKPKWIDYAIKLSSSSSSHVKSPLLGIERFILFPSCVDEELKRCEVQGVAEKDDWGVFNRELTRRLSTSSPQKATTVLGLSRRSSVPPNHLLHSTLLESADPPPPSFRNDSLCFQSNVPIQNGNSIPFRTSSNSAFDVVESKQPHDVMQPQQEQQTQKDGVDFQVNEADNKNESSSSHQIPQDLTHTKIVKDVPKSDQATEDKTPQRVVATHDNQAEIKDSQNEIKPVHSEKRETSSKNARQQQQVTSEKRLTRSHTPRHSEKKSPQTNSNSKDGTESTPQSTCGSSAQVVVKKRRKLYTQCDQERLETSVCAESVEGSGTLHSRRRSQEEQLSPIDIHEILSPPYSSGKKGSRNRHSDIEGGGSARIETSPAGSSKSLRKRRREVMSKHKRLMKEKNAGQSTPGSDAGVHTRGDGEHRYCHIDELDIPADILLEDFIIDRDGNRMIIMRS